MNGIRNIALVGLGLLISFVVINYGAPLAALIFVPLFFLWFTLWDDKKVKQAERQQNRTVSYPHSGKY